MNMSFTRASVLIHRHPRCGNRCLLIGSLILISILVVNTLFDSTIIRSHITSTISITRSTPVFLLQEYGGGPSQESDPTSSLVQPALNLPTKQQDGHPRIMTAWVYDQAIPMGAVSNIASIQGHYPDVPHHVYCATSQCMQAIQAVNNSNIILEFLRIDRIVKNTPLEQWLNRNPIHKVLTGSQFETHLQVAVELGLLWSYGGLYIDPGFMISESGSIPVKSNSSWLARSLLQDASLDLLSLCYFPANHPRISHLMGLFVSSYPTQSGAPFEFQKKARNQLDNSTQIRDIQTKNTLSHLMLNSTTDHYGTLTLDSRVDSLKKANLGDEMQTFPGMNFLPYVDRFLDRDRLNETHGNGNVTAFFNAWWGDKRLSWPPPANINPLLISMHLGVKVREIVGSVETSTNYLKNRGPIGSRDPDTLKFLSDIGVDSYFSGCMTLMQKNPLVEVKRDDKIYIVDVLDEYNVLIPEDIKKQAIVINHQKENMTDRTTRFQESYNLLEMYSRAKLVITQRIHAALPCVAMGTPVIFINARHMPGGGGTKKESSTRIGGFTPLFHTVDLYQMDATRATKFLLDFNWNAPPANPNLGMLMRLRATFWNTIRHNQHLRDAAHKFGTIPLPTPVDKSSFGNQLIFHMIYTDPLESWSWTHMRSVESILYHHPFAKVLIHSNTLHQSQFDVLTDVTYDIKVFRYNLTQLIRASPSHHAEQVKPNLVADHKHLLKLLVLYRYGGVYINHDVIVVRPFDSLAKNTLGWKSPFRTLSDSVMKFEASHPFLAACLKTQMNLQNDITPGGLTGSSSDLLTNTWFDWSKYNGFKHITIMDPKFFYDNHPSDVINYCYSENLPDKAVSKLIQKEAFSVKLNLDKQIAGKGLMKGSICKYLFNDFCILCNEKH